MRRYLAWHKTEPGFDTAKEVENFIAVQDNPEEYAIAATDDDFQIHVEAEQIRRNNYKAIIDSAVSVAIDAERDRIRKILGV